MSNYRHCDKCNRLKQIRCFNLEISRSICIKCRNNKEEMEDYLKRIQYGESGIKKKRIVKVHKNKIKTDFEKRFDISWESGYR